MNEKNEISIKKNTKRAFLFVFLGALFLILCIPASKFELYGLVKILFGCSFLCGILYLLNYFHGVYLKLMNSE